MFMIFSLDCTSAEFQLRYPCITVTILDKVLVKMGAKSYAGKLYRVYSGSMINDSDPGIFLPRNTTKAEKSIKSL